MQIACVGNLVHIATIPPWISPRYKDRFLRQTFFLGLQTCWLDMFLILRMLLNRITMNTDDEISAPSRYELCRLVVESEFLMKVCLSMFL